jgi:hypothetical protein
MSSTSINNEAETLLEAFKSIRQIKDPLLQYSVIQLEITIESIKNNLMISNKRIDWLEKNLRVLLSNNANTEGKSEREKL